MTFGRKRDAVILTAGLVAGMLTTAAPAQAATCQSIPGSTPGTDLRIMGQDHRVPAISNIRVCSDGATAPLVVVDLAGHGYCLSGCLSVLLDGNDLDVGAVTLYYSKDGSVQTSTTDPGPADGPGDECLLSVGSPDAPYPTCLNAIGPDLGNPVGDVTTEVNKAVVTAKAVAADAQADATALVGSVTTEVNKAVVTAKAVAADAQADAAALANSIVAEVGRQLEPWEAVIEDPCGSMGTQQNPQSSWDDRVGFCENPGTWTWWLVLNFCNDYPDRCVVDPREVNEVATEVYMDVYCRVVDPYYYFCYE